MDSDRRKAFILPAQASSADRSVSDLRLSS